MFVWSPWWFAQTVFDERKRVSAIESFELVVDALINTVDVSDLNVNSTIDTQTPKSQRMAILEKDWLKYYGDLVREVELSISAETPLPRQNLLDASFFL